MSINYYNSTRKRYRITLEIEAEDDFEPRNIDYKKLFKIHDNEELNCYIEDLSNTVSFEYRRPI